MGNGLSDRVRDRAQVATRNGGGEVAAQETLAKQIERMHEQFQMAMPHGAEARQLIRDALSLLRTTRNLDQCSSASVLGGLMTFAQLGLRPGVLGHGWLIPFKDWKTKQWQAQIVIGYKGLAELVHRSGAVETMTGRAIHANDLFELEYGITDRLVHKPAMKGPRGEVVGYYAIIKYKGGGYVFWHMTRDEAIEWRNTYAMSAKLDRQTGAVTGSGPWFDMEGPPGGTGFCQMAIKTCFLRAARWAPKGTDLTLARAAEVDGAVRLDTDLDPDRMFEARHPEGNGIVLDGAVVNDDGAEEPEPVDDTPAAPASGDDRPVTDGQGRAIAAILRTGLGKTPTAEQRHAVLSVLLGRPVTSQKDLTFADASRAIDTLNGWQKTGELFDRLAALTGSVAPGPASQTTQELPAPGTREWHAAGHPVRGDDGHVTTVPDLLNGDCGICEDPRDGQEES